MSDVLSLRTSRLLLVAACREDIAAEREGQSRLAERLQVNIPASWPPEGIDDNVLKFFEGGLADPSETGWWFWYVIADSSDSQKGTLVGTCGFKGKPNRVGAVEIGYSMVPEYQRQGYATEAVQALVAWAWGHAPVHLILAETHKENEPSRRVLLKSGFVELEPGAASGNVRYALARPAGA